MVVSSPATSASLLDHARDCDAGAWARLVALYSPLLESWFRAAGLQNADREDLSQRVLEVVVRDRLAGMRARGEQSARVRAASPERRSLRFVIGLALIHLGRRLHGAAESSRLTLEPGPGGRARLEVPAAPGPEPHPMDAALSEVGATSP